MNPTYDLPGKFWGKDPLSNLQVRARPEDPLSPFIWGHAARMMVEGGAWNPANKLTLKKKNGTPRPPKVITDTSGNVLAMEPENSNQATTRTLWRRMRIAGFSSSEAVATFERFPDTGGAYWCYQRTVKGIEWMSKKIREMEETSRDGSGSVLTPIREPMRLREENEGGSPWDPRGLFHLYSYKISHTNMYSVVNNQTSIQESSSPETSSQESSSPESSSPESSAKEEFSGPIYLTPSGTYTVQIKEGALKGILLAIEDLTSRRDVTMSDGSSPASFLEEGVRVTTYKALHDYLAHRRPRPWRRHALMQVNHYLRWLREESYLLHEVDKVHSANKANRKPRGFRLRDIAGDEESMRLFWSAWKEETSLPQWRQEWRNWTETWKDLRVLEGPSLEYPQSRKVPFDQVMGM